MTERTVLKMEFRNFETHGRKLMVEFRCRRCGKTAIRPLEECCEEARECFQALYDLKPPKGWRDGGFYYPLFCPDCKKAYEEFMNGKDGKQ